MRRRVVSAACALPAEVRVAASVALPAAEVNAAILQGQVEMLAVLRRIEVRAPFPVWLSRSWLLTVLGQAGQGSRWWKGKVEEEGLGAVVVY